MKMAQSINENQDVPDHNGSTTSSIGAGRPPREASFYRMKGFYTPSIIDSSHKFREFMREFKEVCYNLSENKLSRVSLRGIISKRLLIEVLPKIRDFLEAIIDLDGAEDFSENLLFYMGYNTPNRMPKESEIEHYRRNVLEARLAKPKSCLAIIDRALKQEYSLEIISYSNMRQNQRECVLNQMTGLYLRFGWKTKDVEEILSSKNNIIAVAQKEKEIVSAGIAEIARMDIGGEAFRIAEITEAATLEEHACKGLYSAVSTFLISEIYMRSSRKEFLAGRADLVYGECNGNALGVLKTSSLQGRYFSSETTSNYGLDGRGILPQHVPISGAPRSTPFNDLFPTYLTTKNLNRFSQHD